MTTQLNLVDLDFAGLKADLIKFLSNQNQFKGYNFAGTNMNVLMDLLSYNTNKNAFLSNMLLSEAFIDSAQLIDSVFSHAKALNYLPRSSKSATATIQVNFSATGISQPYTIQKGSPFSTLVKNSSFIFTVPETIIVSSANNNFSFTTNIFEGAYLSDSYIYSPTTEIPFPKFRLTNKTVDTSSLVVGVINSGSTNAINYIQATSLLGLTNQSQVYFLQPSENGFYEVLFGDNTVGQSPSNNATIILSYRINNATLPNGATNFSIGFDPTGKVSELINTGINNPQVVTINGAQNGADPESIESVRFFAPRFFQTQERAIVPSDYQVLLKAAFPEINAVSAFGGEDNDPPLFGKVIISVNVAGIPTLPTSKRTAYTNFLKQRCPMSIQPIFIDPQFTYIEINSIIRYNINITTNTSNFISSLINTTIANYNINHLNNFNVNFRFSQLSTLIDEADPSIISNITTVQAYKKLTPIFGVPINYTINFGFTLNSNFVDSSHNHPSKTPQCLFTTTFMSNGKLVFLEDDGLGNVNMSTSQGTEDVIIAQVGFINYITGLVTLSNLQIDSILTGQTLQVFVIPSDIDIKSTLNTILLIEPQGINLTIQPVSV